MKRLVDGKVIRVDMVENTLENIKSGEESVLGYNFYSLPENALYMSMFIKGCLEELNVPYKGIHVSSIVRIPEDVISSKDDIVRIIEKDASYYSSFSKRK